MYLAGRIDVREWLFRVRTTMSLTPHRRMCTRADVAGHGDPVIVASRTGRPLRRFSARGA